MLRNKASGTWGAASEADNGSLPDTSGIVLDTQECKLISTKLIFYNDKDSLMHVFFSIQLLS